MTPEQIQLLLDLQFRQTIALEKISLALEKLTPTDAPNYEYPLESFSNFDWGSIGAEVIRKDQFGAAIVTWNGKQFIRRSPSNKFGVALCYLNLKITLHNNNNKTLLVCFQSLSKI